MSHATRIKYFTLEKKHIASLAWELDFYALRKLSASSYRVWHVIRAYAAFDKEQYSATLSQAFLAKKISCSEKTIRRAIAEIKAKKLLEVQSNYSAKNGTAANTYFITFPEEAYVAVEAQDNKKSAAYVMQSINDQQETIIENKALMTHIEARKITSNITHQEVSIENPLGANNGLNPPVKSDRHYREYNFREKNNRELDVVSFSNNDHFFPSIELPLSQAEENLSRLRQQITQLNELKHRLQQELKNVTPVLSEEERLSRLRQALQPAKNNSSDGDHQKIVNDDQATAQKLREQLYVLDNQQERLHDQEKFLQQARELEQHRAMLQQNPYCIHQLSGERKLNQADLSLISTKLAALQLKPSQQHQLMNEVVYEARFGSLVKNNETQQENPVQRALHIGCKLIRYGRWSTPLALKDHQAFRQLMARHTTENNHAQQSRLI